ncbi:methyltransferase [Sandaracinobacter sp. RS1-74]|uniref:class I SAM-dependent methyltransferase n=1 Tax=Sandaracinobacteroides sayramensis TaxID=2913411 RepID=UPI001EDB9A75|nr:methyltransferase [Sandaracinobacteroides sayramensis]MCG2842164.1 methyltransferase [Sandaracinobacteroides sayramensis]
MMRLRIAALVAVATPLLAVAVPAQADAGTAALLDKAIAGSHRSEANRARDAYRHPKETLLFFGLKPEMTVVEISPGGGWYSEILGPVLKDKGRYVAAHNDPAGSAGAQKSRAAFVERVEANPDVFGKPVVSSFGKGIEGHIAAPGSADMVLTFRNVHNWRGAGFAEEAFKAFYAALKPGGVLGVVEHRLPEGRADDEASLRSGYVKQSEVIRLAQAAGFRLDKASEVNANPRDTADHEKGVWTLPPTYALGDTDRAKYAAIGESDRMTLRFVKPAK